MGPTGSWIEPASSVVTTAQLAAEALRSSSLIRRYSKRLLYLIRNGRAVLPIFGPGGVGKTTVSKLLVGADPLSIAAPYSESIDVEVRPLRDDIPGEILVAPGQTRRIPRHWPQLFKTLASGKACGLINVVSYGYHSFMLHSFEEHDVYRNGMTGHQFLQTYADARRSVEIETLQQLIQGMSAVTNPIWMITLITKQDLWWDHRTAVRKYYESGEYGRIIRKLAQEIGERRFQHEFIPVSLTLSSLASQNGDVFAATTQGYDHSIHQRYLLSMFERVHAFLDKGRPIR